MQLFFVFVGVFAYFLMIWLLLLFRVFSFRFFKLMSLLSLSVRSKGPVLITLANFGASIITLRSLLQSIQQSFASFPAIIIRHIIDLLTINCFFTCKKLSFGQYFRFLGLIRAVIFSVTVDYCHHVIVSRSNFPEVWVLSKNLSEFWFFKVNIWIFGCF